MKFDILSIKNYSRASGVYLSASLIASLLNVIINPLMAMNLSPEDYAISTYYTSFGMLYLPIMGFFITDYYLRKYYVIDKQELFELKGNVIKLFVYFSGLVSIICLVALYIFVKGTGVSFDFAPYSFLAVFYTFFSILFSFQLAEYRIARETRKYFNVSVFWGLVNVLLSLVFVVILKLGAVGKMSAAFGGSFLAFIWVLYNNKSYLKVPFNKSIFKQIFLYGYPLVLAAVLSYFTNGYDKVLLERRNDITMLGYYSVACSIAAYINVFCNAIKSTFQPDMYKAISQCNIKKVFVVSSFVVLSVVAIVSVFILFCPLLIKILTAGRYIQSAEMCRIVSLSVITSTIYYQISQFTYGTGHSKLTLVNKTFGTIINVLLITFLVNRYGAYGAAWSTVIGFVVFAIGNILLLLIVRKRLFEKK